jgi:hypothetical protein
MALVEGGKRGFSVLALILGVCSTGPSWAEDWRTLRPIDLPAELFRATWSDGTYLSEGHPIKFGRTAVMMQPSDVARTINVKASSNGVDGLFIDNLTCYNSLGGERMCALLLDRPNRCHLFVYVKTKISDSEHFDVECPADLKLGN